MSETEPEEVFVPYAAKEATEVAPGVRVRVTGVGQFPGKGPDRSHDTGAYLKVTCEQGSLATMIADLDGYISRRAEELAAPVIAAAEESVRNARDETAGAEQRGDDVARELRRRISALERNLARAEGLPPMTSTPTVRPSGHDPVHNKLAILAERAKVKSWIPTGR